MPHLLSTPETHRAVDRAVDRAVEHVVEHVVEHGAERTDGHREDGSLVAEYGLLALVAATVAGVLMTWASGGALADFFDALLSSARGLVGA